MWYRNDRQVIEYNVTVPNHFQVLVKDNAEEKNYEFQCGSGDGCWVDSPDYKSLTLENPIVSDSQSSETNNKSR